MTDKLIRVIVEGGEQLTVPMSQQEWNETQIDLNNKDTDQVFLSDVGFVRKDRLIAAYDVAELERRVQQDARRQQEQVNNQNPRDNRSDRSGNF